MVDAIYLDMDGTIADLYGVDGWLDYLVNHEDPYPYKAAEPMADMVLLDDLIRLVQSMGVTVGVVSWASKGSSNAYKKAVAQAKREWLARYLPSINEVHVVAYGSPKAKHARIKSNAVLIDDDINVRNQWDNASHGRASIDPTNLIEFMASIARETVEAYNGR